MAQRSLQRARAVVRDAVLASARDDEDLTLARTGKPCVLSLDDRGKGGRHSIADDDGHDDLLCVLAAYHGTGSLPTTGARATSQAVPSPSGVARGTRAASARRTRAESSTQAGPLPRRCKRPSATIPLRALSGS